MWNNGIFVLGSRNVIGILEIFLLTDFKLCSFAINDGILTWVDLIFKLWNASNGKTEIWKESKEKLLSFCRTVCRTKLSCPFIQINQNFTWSFKIFVNILTMQQTHIGSHWGVIIHPIWMKPSNHLMTGSITFYQLCFISTSIDNKISNVHN